MPQPIASGPVDSIKGNDGSMCYKFWQLWYVFVGIYNDERVNTVSIISVQHTRKFLILNKKAVNHINNTFIQLRVSCLSSMEIKGKSFEMR